MRAFFIYNIVMNSYVVLLRGINVGGKNAVSMALLREYLTELGFQDVSTYIASGNVLLKSKESSNEVKQSIEELLPKKFKLDRELIKVLVLGHEELKKVVEHKPKEFGNDKEKYYNDAVFLIDITADQAFPLFDPREGVDRVWKGEGVIYSERLGRERTKSRLGKIIGSKYYDSMTIRSWNTVTKLLELLERQ